MMKSRRRIPLTCIVLCFIELLILQCENCTVKCNPLHETIADESLLNDVHHVIGDSYYTDPGSSLPVIQDCCHTGDSHGSVCCNNHLRLPVIQECCHTGDSHGPVCCNNHLRLPVIRECCHTGDGHVPVCCNNHLRLPVIDECCHTENRHPHDYSSHDHHDHHDHLGGTDLICPEVHVETSTPHYHMGTHAYEIPRSSYSPCCTSTFGSASICSTPSAPSYQAPMYQQPYPCHYPAPAAPSYCVQSVVVGGKKEDPEDKNNSKTPNDNGSAVKRPNSGVEPIAGLGNEAGRSNGGGGTSGGGLLGGGGGIEPHANPTTDSHTSTSGGGSGSGKSNDSNDRDRYEKYIEKLLDVMKDKCESDCECEPSPMVVMPKMRVKKVRTCKKRRYRLTSCEEPDPYVVIEEEEEEPSIVFSQPSCCRRSRCSCRSKCCCNRCRCRSYDD